MIHCSVNDRITWAKIVKRSFRIFPPIVALEELIGFLLDIAGKQTLVLFFIGAKNLLSSISSCVYFLNNFCFFFFCSLFTIAKREKNSQPRFWRSNVRGDESVILIKIGASVSNTSWEKNWPWPEVATTNIAVGRFCGDTWESGTGRRLAGVGLTTEHVRSLGWRKYHVLSVSGSRSTWTNRRGARLPFLSRAVLRTGAHAAPRAPLFLRARGPRQRGAPLPCLFLLFAAVAP